VHENTDQDKAFCKLQDFLSTKKSRRPLGLRNTHIQEFKEIPNEVNEVDEMTR
jgi:hypothetical protein